MPVQVVKPENLNVEFDIGTLTGNKISIKLDGTMTKAANGEIGINGGAITVVSGDTGNIIKAGSAGGALLTQSDIESVETVWSGAEPDSFMTITPGGTNGHAVTYGFDWENPQFVEAVQDAIGQGVLAGSGIVYDDVANAIQSSLGNIAFGDGLNYDTVANIVKVKPDTASPSAITVTAAGLSVTPGISADANNVAKLGTDNKVLVDSADIVALADEVLQDAFGVPFANAHSI